MSSLKITIKQVLICAIAIMGLQVTATAQLSKKELRSEKKAEAKAAKKAAKSNTAKAKSKSKGADLRSDINGNKIKKNTPEDTYSRLGYKAAILEFKEKESLSIEDKIKIANSYRLNADVENAVRWYKEVVYQSSEPIHKLHYAQSLQSSGDKLAAIQYFKEYNDAVGEQDLYAEMSKVFSENLSDTDRFKSNAVELRNEKYINTDKLEYSPAFYKNGITFVSTKKPEKLTGNGKDPWLNDNFMALYYAPSPERGALVRSAEPLSYDITTKFHEGPVSFNSTGDKIFFTRNHFLKGKRTNSSDGVMKLQIYSSDYTEEGWSTPKELAFNTKEHEECHPTVTSNGMTMYFASDRPGGLGGMDIYKSEYSGGKWGQPTNMGPSINTAGNELFPFIHKSGMLFFASNGKDGLGGLDIFQSVQNNGEWTEAMNIGTPFNSPKDDFGFILNNNSTYGYLTSARSEGYGKDDIYSFAIEESKISSRTAKICTNLDADGSKIPGAELLIREYTADCDLDKAAKACDIPQFTDKNGYLKTILDPSLIYHITAKKDGYEDVVEIVSGADIMNSKEGEHCIAFTQPAMLDCIELEATVIHKMTNAPITNAVVVLKNNTNGSIVEYITNSKGQIDFGCIPCNSEFMLLASKPNLGNDDADVSTINIECTKENKLSKVLKLGQGNLTASTHNSERVYSSGDIIVLDNIYYDFDKYYIRPDAAKELDHIVNLMNTYPSMVIELGSHTDARASNKYNDKLSSKRARAAVNYIIKNGIASYRLQAKGYGESMPRNECRDNVECSEVQHQYNRRTEIKIIQIDPNTQVQYSDKGPQTIDKAAANRRWSWK